MNLKGHFVALAIAAAITALTLLAISIVAGPIVHLWNSLSAATRVVAVAIIIVANFGALAWRARGRRTRQQSE
jgi:hypothetical protein